MFLLGKEELDNLVNGTYRYKLVNDSLLEPVMKPHWDWSVQYVPRWLHPNTISLLGFLALFPSYILMIYYSVDMTEEVPGYVTILGVLGVYLFQFLDNLDGRQARRLGVASCAGDFLDHSLDILSLNVCAPLLCTAFAAGPNLLVVLGFMCPAATHYFTFWDRFHTREIYLGPVSMTEGQFAVMGLLTLAWATGPQFWNESMGTIMGIVLYRFYVPLVLVIAVFVFAAPAGIITRVWTHPDRPRSTAALFISAIPIYYAIFTTVVWAVFSPELMQGHPRLLVTTAGIMGSNVASAMNIASITRGSFNRILLLTVLPVILATNAILPASFPYHFPLPPVDPLRLAWAALLVSVFIQTYIVFGGLYDITRFLGIPALVVPREKRT